MLIEVKAPKTFEIITPILKKQNYNTLCLPYWILVWFCLLFFHCNANLQFLNGNEHFMKSYARNVWWFERKHPPEEVAELGAMALLEYVCHYGGGL